VARRTQLSSLTQAVGRPAPHASEPLSRPADDARSVTCELCRVIRQRGVLRIKDDEP
jgi:hypothetical protein